MASIMAPIPKVFFCFIEPIMISASAINVMFHPAEHSVPLLSYVPVHEVAATEKLAIIELGNMMLLIAAFTTILMWTRQDPRTVHLAIAAMALVDIPYWISAVAVMGWDRFLDFGSWSRELKTQMIGPLVTMCIKVAYLLGWLGADRVRNEKGKKA